jgi:DNA-binding MarR family transcriptional regulator
VTEAQKQFILDRLGKLPQSEIARQLGIHQSTIANFKRRLAKQQFESSLPADRRRRKAGGQSKYG